MTKSIGRKLVTALSWLGLMVIMSGCTLGLRQETRIIYGNVAAPAANGAVRIATNEVIQVTADTDVGFMDLGGYYVLSPGDMKLFVRLLKEQK